ncbi:MAG TPA: hypothetical protein DCG30_08090 [Ruminococcus sp.]|nr:hypothetical protein [Ruminococcus sp.]
MKSFFANIWTKRVFALLSLLYTFIVGSLCYYSVFYKIHIPSRVNLMIIAIVVSVLALVNMLYTRHQIITRICSFLILPLMLPVVLLYFGEWEMIIPIIVTGVIILLLSGAGEGAKTAFGTIILLLYIFGALGYFLFTSFFVSSAVQHEVESGVSPTGLYRYRVVNTEDTSNGSTAVYVEPNYADVVYPFATFTLKNMERIVYQERPICENIDIQWTTMSRSDITKQLDDISDNIAIHPSDENLAKFGHTFNDRLQLSDIETEDKFKLGLTASDVDPIPLSTLTDEQLAIFNIARDSMGDYYIKEPTEKTLEEYPLADGEKLYLKDMSTEWLSNFYITLKNSMLLSELSDSDLADLGVSESGDVMLYNGKICFRYYVAELENYFDVTSRKLSTDLLET